jgi:micrococcal nuclease
MHASDFATTCHHAGQDRGKNLRMIWFDEPTKVAYGMLMKRQIMIGLALAALTAWPAVSWADFVARVVTVHEGDRLTIYHDGRRETIYLKDVDCPELKQPYGKQAKRVTVAYLGTREVVIRALTRNRQGRVTAEVVLQDGRNVAHELLKEGLAWSRPQLSEGQSLKDMEELARAAGKGLWSDPHPVPPWKWKASKNTGLKFSN